MKRASCIEAIIHRNDTLTKPLGRTVAAMAAIEQRARSNEHGVMTKDSTNSKR